MDTNSNGTIDWTESVAAALDHPQYLTRDACWTAFNVFDLDGDGTISPKDLERVLFEGYKGGQLRSRRSRKKAEELLQQIDAGDEGTINFDQFMDVMLTASGMESKSSDGW